MKKKIIISVIIILCLLIPFLLIQNKKTSVKYVTFPVSKRTITEIVEASGTIEPVNTVDIGSQVSGRIEEIYVDYNSKVKKGQVLAQIDTSLFVAQLQQAQANINSARANLDKAQATLELDTKNYKRYKNLYARNLVAKNDVDKIESSYKTDVAQVAAARASILQAQAQYATASANMRYTQIISPVDGTVISKKVEVGQTVAASFQTPTLFQVAQDLTEMQIETSVSEADIVKVQEGQEVEYTIDGYPNNVFYGKVKQIRISPTTESNVVTYTVIIDVTNEERKLMPGMTANVSIIINKVVDALVVPNRALKFTPQNNKIKYEHQGIWIMANKKPERVDIETGTSDDSYTQIISDSISEGTEVVISEEGNNNKSSKSRTMPRPL